jgi:hypothetical protein
MSPSGIQQASDCEACVQSPLVTGAGPWERMQAFGPHSRTDGSLASSCVPAQLIVSCCSECVTYDVTSHPLIYLFRGFRACDPTPKGDCQHTAPDSQTAQCKAPVKQLDNCHSGPECQLTSAVSTEWVPSDSSCQWHCHDAPTFPVLIWSSERWQNEYLGNT